MNDKVIVIKDLGKTYRLYGKPSDRAKEALSLKRRKYHQDFQALKGVDLVVSRGETVGILGRNGSGKSTLLKILTGVSAQTSGEVMVKGKVAALLELGAGFNVEMTGMENIFLNGTMQGISRSAMEKLVPSIVEFADIGEFIDQPVKTYSSGMFVRLAFALAINVDPDVLIVDEALSVGDIYFQAKCYQKFEDFKKAGKTILFVTHDLNSVLKYCDRAMVLNEGIKIAEGSPKEMVDLYKKVVVNLHDRKDAGVEFKGTVDQPMGHSWKNGLEINPNGKDYGDGKMAILDFGLFEEEGRLTQSVLQHSECVFKMRVRIEDDLNFPIFAMTIKDIKGNELAGTNSKIELLNIPSVHRGEEYIISFRQSMQLQGGHYFVSFGCTRFDESGEFVVHHRLYDIFSFQVIASKFVVGIFDMGIKMNIEHSR
jgi:teichoic acid transport system ATP-binding protein